MSDKSLTLDTLVNGVGLGGQVEGYILAGPRIGDGVRGMICDTGQKAQISVILCGLKEHDFWLDCA